MLARLILVLLLATFAVPANAAPACHDQPKTHHAMPAMPDDKTPPAHVCIGCIPPGDWTGASVAAPTLLAKVTARVDPVRLDIGTGAPPATPPPRAG